MLTLTSLTMLLFIVGEEVIQGILWCFTILLLLLRRQKTIRGEIHKTQYPDNLKIKTQRRKNSCDFSSIGRIYFKKMEEGIKILQATFSPVKRSLCIDWTDFILVVSHIRSIRRWLASFLEGNQSPLPVMNDCIEYHELFILFFMVQTRFTFDLQSSFYK